MVKFVLLFFKSLLSSKYIRSIRFRPTSFSLQSNDSSDILSLKIWQLLDLLTESLTTGLRLAFRQISLNVISCFARNHSAGNLMVTRLPSRLASFGDSGWSWAPIASSGKSSDVNSILRSTMKKVSGWENGYKAPNTSPTRVKKWNWHVVRCRSALRYSMVQIEV